MGEVLTSAIDSCNSNEIVFCKYITANDAGSTGSHQSGFHIHKNSWALFFDEPGVKGSNKDKFVTIKWQNDFETNSRFIYYGTGTRNEYRLTRFGKGFPYLNDENIGNLLIITKIDAEYFEAFVLEIDDDIDHFFFAFDISPSDVNGIIKIESEEELIPVQFQNFINSLTVDFPTTLELSMGARRIINEIAGITNDNIISEPDKIILSWLNTEYDLFKAIENDRYKEIILHPINSVESLVEIANSILNRRKSRAGKSLEHHLAEIFDIWELSYEREKVTENNKKPDFIFPDIDTYHFETHGSDNLVFLGAKRTCKDRWRQILNEAAKVPNKHLFTLQQGISSNQLSEMESENVILVVPESYRNSFPQNYRSNILSLNNFLNHVLSTQS